ncbi:16S rRNA (guanine(527)-N(7))-methyltransferase RsmG [Hahella sp. CCB-MM4]|uniref:16S rRNA (guanine(527)-N(7))-methyltransferase RsmG n=1 Tax=Hahella sp. (strain CCB-MM4) TaxID=1926491 RepID=UPI000B9B7D69|nr:16S rRNA (guanine(527)-N(7))-methyltransferase RsmG [Hahella sp. CCB-MM4]OZG73230.1 16S rRNA (guanine(527)-N(7))-methyltransferase RsmG [Hahella sp. CCB-MM4]
MENTLRALQKQQLQSGLGSLELSLDEKQQERLLDYLELLHKWNKAYNLTAVRDPELHVSRHILDALAVIPHIEGKYFLDVGTGPGIPGIPLAIALPETQWVLLDSNGKKTRFLTQCKMSLGLSNVEVVQSRIEQYRPATEQSFDGITSRAFATLADMVTGCQDLFGPETKAYALKGVSPVEEIEALPENFIVIQNHRLSVPACDGERHLLILGKS